MGTGLVFVVIFIIIKEYSLLVYSVVKEDCTMGTNTSCMEKKKKDEIVQQICANAYPYVSCTCAE